VADYIEFENILVSERGVFEVQSGKQVDGLERAHIAQIRVAYSRAAQRPLLEGVVGVVLFAFGIWGVWLCLQSLKGFRYCIVLLVMGILGAAMLWDVLKKRYVLFVTARDGHLHKLSFSVAAYPADIELFLQKARQNFGLEIQSDVADIKT
jgi:hypothetical protein